MKLRGENLMVNWKEDQRGPLKDKHVEQAMAEKKFRTPRESSLKAPFTLYSQNNGLCTWDRESDLEDSQLDDEEYSVEIFSVRTSKLMNNSEMPSRLKVKLNNSISSDSESEESVFVHSDQEDPFTTSRYRNSLESVILNCYPGNSSTSSDSEHEEIDSNQTIPSEGTKTSSHNINIIQGASNDLGLKKVHSSETQPKRKTLKNQRKNSKECLKYPDIVSIASSSSGTAKQKNLINTQSTQVPSSGDSNQNFNTNSQKADQAPQLKLKESPVILKSKDFRKRLKSQSKIGSQSLDYFGTFQDPNFSLGNTKLEMPKLKKGESEKWGGNSSLTTSKVRSFLSSVDESNSSVGSKDFMGAISQTKREILVTLKKEQQLLRENLVIFCSNGV
jgi:hypothetical protein